MKWLAAALIALPVLATTSPAVDDKAPETILYPLEVGNSWQYKAGEISVTYRVAKHEKVGDVDCAVIEMLKDDQVQSTQHLGVNKEGLCRFKVEGRKLDQPVCILKLPPKQGETWTVDSKSGSETLKGKFKTGEAEVTVPAGTYKTITSTSQGVQVGGMKPVITYYFADKVGMVKQVIEMGKVKLVLELVKFTPGKK